MRALNLVESAGIGATSTFMPLFANALTNSYILVGSIVAGYGLAQALSYTYFGKLYDRQATVSRTSIIQIGYLVCAVAFFLHLLAYDGLTLFGVRLAAGVATGMYAGALIAKSYENASGRFTLAGIWALNFLLVLPVLNPRFVTLMPYAATLASKALFGLTMAAVLARGKRLV